MSTGGVNVYYLSGTPSKQGGEIIATHDLLLDQELGQRREDLSLRRQGLADALVGCLEELSDLVVDTTGGLLAVLSLTHRRNVEKERLARRLERRQPQSFGHPITGDHVACHVGGPLEVVLRTGRDIPEDELLRHATAEQHVEA